METEKRKPGRPRKVQPDQSQVGKSIDEMNITEIESPPALIAETPLPPTEVRETVNFDKPWTPAARLTVLNKDPNYEYGFQRDDDVMMKQADGWEVCHWSEHGPKVMSPGLHDAKEGVDSVLRVRELVLMRMPKELHANMKKYYLDQAPTLDDMTARFEAETQGLGTEKREVRKQETG